MTNYLTSRNKLDITRGGDLSRYDEGRDGYLDLTELKKMMEKLGAPQTHLGLKAMIKEVDEDDDNRISFREVRVDHKNINFSVQIS